MEQCLAARHISPRMDPSLCLLTGWRWPPSSCSVRKKVHRPLLVFTSADAGFYTFFNASYALTDAHPRTHAHVATPSDSLHAWAMAGCRLQIFKEFLWTSLLRFPYRTRWHPVLSPIILPAKTYCSSFPVSWFIGTAEPRRGQSLGSRVSPLWSLCQYLQPWFVSLLTLFLGLLYDSFPDIILFFIKNQHFFPFLLNVRLWWEGVGGFMSQDLHTAVREVEIGKKSKRFTSIAGIPPWVLVVSHSHSVGVYSKFEQRQSACFVASLLDPPPSNYYPPFKHSCSYCALHSPVTWWVEGCDPLKIKLFDVSL